MTRKVASPGGRLGLGLLGAGTLAAFLSLGGPDALKPFAALPAEAAQVVYVAFVVDFGGGAGTPAGVVSACAKVPAGDDGYQALGVLESERSWQASTYNSAGLLCSIDGYPAGAPGVCGEQTANGYDYWSYWHGTGGSWSYATTGAFAVVGSGDVEGWRFETDSQDSASDPPPGAVAGYAAICSPAAIAALNADGVTTTTAPATAPPSTAPPSSSPPVTTAGGTSSAGSGNGGAPTAGSAPVTASTAPQQPSGTGATPTTSPPATVPRAGGGGSERRALGPARSAASRSGAGSPLPLLLTLGALVMGGAAILVRRWQLARRIED